MKTISIKDKAIACLAYSLFDAENSVRLGEQNPEVVDNYFRRAKDLLLMIQTYQNKEAKENLTKAILNE